MTKLLRNFNISFSALFFIVLISHSAPGAICPLGDLDGNCKVDLVDVQILTGFWLDPGCVAPGCEADLSAGGGVNLTDYAWLAANHEKTGVHVVISVYMADNENTIVDGLGEYSDWIELYNPSDVAVDLGGCYLTDEDDLDPLWPFPRGTILPGNSYLLVFASGKTEEENPDNYPFKDELGYLHTDFKLQNAGEYLALVLPDGQTVEYEYPDEYPQYDDWSYGLSPDLQSEGYFFPATPGKPNTSSEPIADPTKNVVISEIMYHPYHDYEHTQPEPTYREFIEIYNRGIMSVNLTNWRFSDGVDFTFPAKTLDSKQYLVVAADVSAFLSAYPQVNPDLVLGGWTGRLSNSGEDIDLDDETGLRMDSVHYYDQGDWSSRELGPLDYEHRGWMWNDDHDGGGKSLELIQPSISNNYGQNWAASLDEGGTPGQSNTVAETNLAPMILEGTHKPLIPKNDEPVRVTVRIRDESTANCVVKLHYREDESTYGEIDEFPQYDPDSYTIVTMHDDGLNGDWDAGDGAYTAEIPAYAAGTIIEYFVEADDGVQTRTWPAPADVDGQSRQVVNCLYQVYQPDPLFDPDDDWTPGSQPVYQIIMTQGERGRLQEIHSGGDQQKSDAQMNATFISSDGIDTKLRYNCGIRNRGHGTRDDPPYNYRVNFRNDEPWKSVTAINLNSQYTYLQYFGHTLLTLSGLPSEDPLAVQLRINGVNYADDYVSRTQGSYVHLEVYNSEWAENHFPDDPDGNVYDGVSYHFTGDYLANLAFMGWDPNTYNDDNYYNKTVYGKHSNTALHDWSDLINLTYILDVDETSEEDFLAQVEQVIHHDQWLRWFAVQNLISNQENGLANGRPDDYFMYFGLEDPRCILLPHDLDVNLTRGSTSSDIWLSGRVDDLPEIERFVQHPKYAGDYYAQFRDLFDTVFAQENFDSYVEQLLNWTSASTRSSIKSWMANRQDNVLTGGSPQIPQYTLTIQTDLPENPADSGLYKTAGPGLSGDNLSGTADIYDTRSVLVNGIPADWDHIAGDWSLDSSIPLNPGINRVIVQTFDELDGQGNELEREFIDIWYEDGDTSSVPNPLTLTNTVLDAASGPWRLEAALTIPTGKTLAIEPGTTVYINQGVRITVIGRIVAEGTEYQRIWMGLDPNLTHTAWGGFSFSSTTQDNRLCYVDLEKPISQSHSIDLDTSTLLLDNVTFPGVDPDATNGTVLEGYYVDLIIRNSVIPPVTDQPIHGNYIRADGKFILEGNIFEEGVASGADIIDYTHCKPPGPIMEVYNNIFLGGRDDALDLDDTDAHVEGNIFYAFANGNHNSGSTANAVATDDASVIYLARNIFIGGDHHVLLKGDVWVTAQNNVFVGATMSAINFGEPHREPLPGNGALLEGNIFLDNAAVFYNLFNNSEYPGVGPVTDPVLRYCMLPTQPPTETDHIVFETGNMLDVNPHFVDPDNDDYHLRYFSPAVETGPLGLDIGAYVPEGAALKLTTLANSAAINVGGPGITHYQYVLNDLNGAWSSETPVSQPIQLTGLVNEQTYTVYAIGKNFAGVWQDPDDAASVTWTVSNYDVPLVLNEVLAINDTAVEHNGQYPDMIELYYGGDAPIFLDNMTITDDPDEPLKYIIPPGAMLDSTNRYLVLYADPNTAESYHTGFALDGDGETVYLYDSTGHLLDSVEFGTQVSDLSIGRVNQGPWRLTVPTMGQENQVQDLGVPDALKINEWLANGTVLFADDFIELYNPDLLPVDLSGMFLSDNPIAQPDRHSLSPLSYIPGEDYKAFDADDSDNPGHANFQLNATKEMILLLDPERNMIDQVFYGPQTTDVSQGRSPDGGDLLAFYELPTPNIANTTADIEPTTLELVTDGAQVKYVVPSDSTWESTWMLPTFTDLLSWTDDNTALGFGEVFGPVGSGRTAYNDCIRGTGDSTAANVTSFTLYSGSGSYPTTGTLQDFQTGNTEGMPTVTFTAGNLCPDAGNDDPVLATGTDLYDAFGGIIDFANGGHVAYGSTGWWIDIEFSDLNPYGRYSFIGTSIRNTDSDYSDRVTRCTISGHTSATNNSSEGTGIWKEGDITRYWAWNNDDTGHVVRWDDIDPGVDGIFKVRSECNAGAGEDTRKAYPLHAFQLQVIGAGENPLEQAMVGTNATLWTRIEFDLDENPTDISILTLRMRYDDAFVAYLNGNEVARSNFTGTPRWDSVADADRDNALAANWQTFDLDDSIALLQAGANVLAVQVMNESMNDPNLLYLPELKATVDPNTDTAHYEMALNLLRGLRITEMMYHPQDEPAGHPDAEFIELLNVGPVELNLAGVRFTDGIDYTFPTMTLSPGDYIVIVKDPAVFQSQYGVIPEVIGAYDGSLSNGGEDIVLKLPAPFEAAIMRFEYDDAWFPTTDGGGYALVAADPYANASRWLERDGWLAGSTLKGSPGAADP